MMNAERVEIARDKSMTTKMETASKKKKNWDEKAKERKCEVGEEVLVRKPGMNFKLCDSWEGPFKIAKKNSPLFCEIDTWDRKIPSVHIHLIKKYYGEQYKPRVGRVTSVFEPDSKEDDN